MTVDDPGEDVGRISERTAKRQPKPAAWTVRPCGTGCIVTTPRDWLGFAISNRRVLDQNSRRGSEPNWPSLSRPVPTPWCTVSCAGGGSICATNCSGASGHVDPHLGQAWNEAPCTARPTLRLGLPVRRGLSATLIWVAPPPRDSRHRIGRRPRVRSGSKFTATHTSPGGSHEEALYYRRAVLGHDLGLCRQWMRSRFAALELPLVAPELRFTAPTVQLVGIKLRFIALERRLAVLELRFATLERRLAVLELRFAALERQLAVLELRFAALERQLVRIELRFATFELWFTTPKIRACFRPGSGVAVYFPGPRQAA
jgi:hypothetical protein